jgi:hypothetical protein
MNLSRKEDVMAYFMCMNEQRNARHDVANAVAYAAPLWASGLLALITVFVLMGPKNFIGFEFSALAIVFVLAIIAAFHAMARDLQRDSVLCSATYRRMMLCSDLDGGAQASTGRNAIFKLQDYALAGTRQRAHMRSPYSVATSDESLHKRRRLIRHR